MEHLTDDLLVRYMDDELSAAEVLFVEPHLASCKECKAQLRRLREAAKSMDELFLLLQPSQIEDERDDLARALTLNRAALRPVDAEASRRVGQSARSVFGMVSWAAGLAACLAIGVYFAAAHRVATTSSSETEGAASAIADVDSFDIDGEKFWALPYSNPNLPVAAPRIVEMEVPVASLADAGIIVTPVSSRAATPDRAVLADVLLGLDGQPVGVHVLSSD